MGHDENEHSVTREDLYKPLDLSFIGKYVIPPVGAIFDGPVTFFKEQVVDKVRKPYPYYHRRYDRVPTIDECKLNDYVCFVEANAQFFRDRLVDANIVQILRKRRDDCANWYRNDVEDVARFCDKHIKEHEDAAVNYFIKYGELSWNTDVRDAFMKQKHRMLWERRYGQIGTGMSGERSSAVDTGDKEAHDESTMFGKMRRSFGTRFLPKEMGL